MEEEQSRGEEHASEGTSRVGIRAHCLAGTLRMSHMCKEHSIPAGKLP